MCCENRRSPLSLGQRAQQRRKKFTIRANKLTTLFEFRTNRRGGPSWRAGEKGGENPLTALRAAPPLLRFGAYSAL